MGASPNQALVSPLWTASRPSAIVIFMSVSVSANIDATANSEHLSMLLREKDPGFLAILELAVNRVDRELDGECPGTAWR
jgi:hypothetical protein